jgi:hypothetical protein
MTVQAKKRVEQAGRRLRWLVRALALLTPVAVAVVLFLKGPLGLVSVPRQIAVDPRFLTFPRSLAIIAVGLLRPGAWLLAAFFLDRLFGLYARGVVFSPRNIALIRQAGYVLAAIDGVRILESALTGPVLGLIGATRPYVNVELQISMLMVGLSIVAISHVMEMGRELSESDELTI